MSETSPTRIPLLKRILLACFRSLGLVFGRLPGVFVVIDFLVKALHLNEGNLSKQSYGVDFDFDLTDYTHRKFYFHCFERSEIDYLISQLPKSGKIVDVGANVGFIALVIAKSRPKVQVFAIEPIPNTFSTLESNRVANSLKNVSCMNFAVGTKDEELKFSNEHSSSDTSSGFWHKTQGNETGLISVNCVEFRNVIKGIEAPIDLVKIDAEGMELEILCNLGSLLAQGAIRSLMIEITFDNDGCTKLSVEVIDLLVSSGYTVYSISMFGHLKRFKHEDSRRRNNVLNVIAK